MEVIKSKKLQKQKKDVTYLQVLIDKQVMYQFDKINEKHNKSRKNAINELIQNYIDSNN